MTRSVPTITVAAGADTGLLVPSDEDLRSGRTHGASARNFYELRARQKPSGHSEFPFYDLDNAGGKACTTAVAAMNIERRYGLMREGTEMRFRGVGGAKFGLYMSTPVNLGPGQYIKHDEWIPKGEVTATLSPVVAHKALSLPTSPASAASPDSPQQGSTLGWSLVGTAPSSPSGDKHASRRVSRSLGGERYNRCPNTHTGTFRSGQLRIEVGPTAWIILHGRSSEPADSNTLETDARERTKKFGGALKGMHWSKAAKIGRAHV